MSDPFEVLGVPRAFSIDGKRMQERFIALTAENHPDRFTDPIDQADAAERAAEINDAHRVLSDPMLRGEALIKLLGGPGTREESTALPEGFLMEVMEVREGMEEAREAGDAAKLAGVKAEAMKEYAARLKAMGACLDKACAGDAASVAKARKELNALRYVKRMIEGAGPG